MKRIYRLTLLALLSVCLTACCDGDKEEQTTIKPSIDYLFSVNDWDDGGYSDLAASAITTIANNNRDVNVSVHKPTTAAMAEQTFKQWIERTATNKELFILAGSDYKALINKYVADKLPTNKSILIFESDPTKPLPDGVSTFFISSFGTSYITGGAAAYLTKDLTRNILVLLANQTDMAVKTFGDGFKHGFNSSTHANNRTIDTEYLGEGAESYIMADEAYAKMDNWSNTHDFIFPITGGSNLGIYRWSNEHPANSPLLSGTDLDQSPLCSKIIGSCVKHTDRLIMLYVNQWIGTGKLPKSELYGIESGYAEYVSAPGYNLPPALYNDLQAAAITAEQQYLNQ